MTSVSRSLDDLDRLGFRLARTVQTQYPHLLSQGFTLSDLEERLLPYRDARREMANSDAGAFEVTLLRLVSGERGYLLTHPRLQAASLHALNSTSPTLTLVSEWATTSLRLGNLPGAAQANVHPGATIDLLPCLSTPAIKRTQSSEKAPPCARPGHRDENGRAGANALTPEQPSRTSQLHCRFCDGQLPAGRKITYCPHCGMDLTKRQCQACSTELEAHWRYCVTCGRGS